ncbi:MAG TPA: hypothetical protein GXX29_10810 [Firmicutes bacterium]|nr:hypothetical protein [Bacillota bacterium]
MTLAESAGPDDITEETEGLKFVIDRRTSTYLQGAVIDYRKSWLNEGFIITSPNGSTC